MKRDRKRLVLGACAVTTALCGPSTAMAFDPTSGEERLPTTATEAERYVRETAYFYSQEYPDRVRCALINEGGQDVFECWVAKAGVPDQLIFVVKGAL
jgi:hypothetical protein